MYMVIPLVILVVSVLLFMNQSKGTNKVQGTVIGFETVNKSWTTVLVPILSYEVNGKKYRCVMHLLNCENTEQNKLIYMNKQYTLYYDENHPNRVMIKSVSNTNYLIIILLFSWIVITLSMIFMLR